MSTFMSVYEGREDQAILEHIDKLGLRYEGAEELTSEELHVLLASWERLEILTTPKRGLA